MDPDAQLAFCFSIWSRVSVCKMVLPTSVVGVSCTFFFLPEHTMDSAVLEDFNKHGLNGSSFINETLRETERYSSSVPSILSWALVTYKCQGGFSGFSGFHSPITVLS